MAARTGPLSDHQPGHGGACPNPDGWQPSKQETDAILAAHREWAKRWAAAGSTAAWADRHPQGRANLRNLNADGANLHDVELQGADLTRAKLNRADLTRANLTGADLTRAELNGAVLASAKPNGAKLEDAEPNGADLSSGAELRGANLALARLNGRAILAGANLSGADLTDAASPGAELNGASLYEAKLARAVLLDAELNGADLTEADLGAARIARAKLAYATYTPASSPPDVNIAGIEGLDSVQFPPGGRVGLVQLRKLAKDGGDGKLERQITFAIEHGKVRHAIENWDAEPLGAVEAWFSRVAFGWTAAYGLRPGQALVVPSVIWALLIPVYAWAIWAPQRWPQRVEGLYLAKPEDRIEMQGYRPVVPGSPELERLEHEGLSAIGWAAYFSLLSAFHIGFGEFSVGTWLARVQAERYSLEAVGWVPQCPDAGHSRASTFSQSPCSPTSAGRSSKPRRRQR